MSKQIEALKIALEGLEYIHEGANNQGPHTGISWRCVSNKAEPAITAIREALADSALDRMAENARELGLDYEPPCKTGSQCTSKCPKCDEPHEQPHCNDCGGFDPECPLAQPAQKEQQVSVPVTDNTYNYAKNLAESIFKQHFASDEHYASGRIVWGVNDTVIGILTQIDNMVADMVRRPAQQQEPEKDWGAIGQAHLVALKKSSRELMEEAAVRVVHKMAQQQEPVAVYVGETWCGSVVRLYEELPLETPLYTSPPASKPWVGLTQQDINIAFDDTQEGGGFDDFARAIEAKLREKNAPQQSKEDA